MTFRDRSVTKEQELAWEEVLTWGNSFLKPEYRSFTNGGAIGLDLTIEEMEEALRTYDEELMCKSHCE